MNHVGFKIIKCDLNERISDPIQTIFFYFYKNMQFIDHIIGLDTETSRVAH